MSECERPAITHRWSADCGEIFSAIAKAQTEIKNAVKDSTNPHFRAKYADLASVKDACWDALTKHGIAVVQMPINGDGSSIGIVTVFGHSSGQWIESTIFVAPTKFDAQGAGSTITYLRRYALSAMAGVAPDDDDGNAAVSAPPQRQPRPEPVRQSTPASDPVPMPVARAEAPPAQDKDAEFIRKFWMRDYLGIDPELSPGGLNEWGSWYTRTAAAAPDLGAYNRLIDDNAKHYLRWFKVVAPAVSKKLIEKMGAIKANLIDDNPFADAAE